MHLKSVLKRLKKQSTILSLVSQIVTILILLGVQVDISLVNSIAMLVCSILVTLGIISNPDSVKQGFGDDILQCSREGAKTLHVEINGKMVCKDCGAIYNPPV